MRDDHGGGTSPDQDDEAFGDAAGPHVDPHPQSLGIAALGAVELSALLAAGEVSTVEVVEHLVSRVEALDVHGPGVRSVLELSPDALEVADALDAERGAGRARGPLHGVPVFVKDNIDTVAPLHTTAGSLVFGDCSPGRDASLVTALRAAGAVVLGKTNLSEWANFRGRPSSSGWSAAGGQTRNPHALDRSPGGSSSGSAAAVAALLAPLSVGTETDGSIICPAAACGVAGLKPTAGLVSRTGVVPISFSQDSPGPLGRCTRDVALLLEVLAGAGAVDDGEDEMARAGRRPAAYRTDYSALLGDGNLAGLRVGAVRDDGFVGYHAATDAVFESALDALASTGAQVVDPVTGLPGDARLSERELTVLTHEFGAGARAYFERRARLGPARAHLPRSLGDVLAHAVSEPAERTDVFGTDLLALSEATRGLDAPEYRAALEQSRRSAGPDGIDKVLAAHDLDLLVAPAMQPAWPIDHVLGDHPMGCAWGVAAIAGYPSATLPMGAVHGLPVGLALLGPAWSEALLLRVMAALERVLGTAAAPVPRFARHTRLLA